MTKLILAASILLLTFFPESFDKEKKKKKDKANTEVSYHAEQAFFAQFGYMKNVTWESAAGNNYRANFEAYGEQISAFYNTDGNYVAHTIKRKLHELPMRLRVALQNEFADKELVEIIQMFTNEEACWYIEVKQDKGTAIYKGMSYGNLKLHEVRSG